MSAHLLKSFSEILDPCIEEMVWIELIKIKIYIGYLPCMTFPTISSFDYR